MNGNPPNPFDHWLANAHHFVSKLNLPSDFLLEARAIVEGAFTQEWFIRHIGKENIAGLIVPIGQHPLAMSVQMAGENQIVQVLELAIYIKKLLRCKNLPEVIKIIKNSFFTGYMQLSFAYRFQRAGAKNIELEPRTDRGKSDIYFEYDNTPYLVECYVPQPNKKSDATPQRRKTVSIISEACDASKKILRICIWLKRSGDPSEETKLAYHIAKCIREMIDEKFLKGENEIMAYEILDVTDDPLRTPFPSKESTDPKLYKDADWGVQMKQIKRKDLSKVALGEEVEEIEGSSLLVWRPESEKEEFEENEYVEGLKEKISKKIEQTKKEGSNARRIVIAYWGFGAETDESSEKIARRIQHYIIPKFENVSCAILTRRYWLKSKRYQFRSTFLMGKKENIIPKEFFQSLGDQEHKNDVLWEYK